MAGTHRGDQPQRRVPQGSARPRPARRPRRAAARPPDQPGTGLPLRSRRPHGARLLVAGTPGRRLPHPFLGRRPRHPGSRQSGLAAPARPADPPRPARRRRRRLRAGAAAHGNPADLRLALYPQVQRIGDAPRAKPRPAGAKHARRPGRGDRTRRRLCRTGLQQGHAGAGEQPHHPARAHRVQRRRAAAPLPAALLAEQRVHPRTAGKLPAAVPPGSRRQPARRHPSPRPGAPPVSDNTFSMQRFRALPTEIHVMLVGTLLTRGAYFMVWPFLALLLWREFRLSASAIGLLLALATVCGALSGIYTGWLSDRFGRKRLIFFGTSLSGLSFVLLGFSGQPLSYGLAISGVSIGCALLESSCKALIGDRVEDRRSRELALYCRYFLINLGAALGPLIGLTLGVAAQAGTFLVTALVYFCYGLLLWRLLHHLELKRRSLAPRSSTGFLEACLSMARHRAFTLLLLCNMLAALIYATFDSTLVQYLTRSGLPDVVNSIALLVTINALTIVVAQFPLLRLLENTGTGGRLMLGMLLMLLAQLGFAWTPVTLFAGLALATVVLSLGELIVFPTFSVEVDQLTPDDLRGSYFGAANLYSLGTALAPLYGGIMLDHAGSQALYLGLAALCGVIMLLQVGAVGLRQAERAGG
ncbi:probable major facilitator superfamily (MFS) transporter [Pseudomonas aeruginosa PAK]|nr:probable major facilitator superfamily (MFS) transporter [Pseudomonas aeruginosa PAK]